MGLLNPLYNLLEHGIVSACVSPVFQRDTAIVEDVFEVLLAGLTQGAQLKLVGSPQLVAEHYTGVQLVTPSSERPRELIIPKATEHVFGH